MDSQNSNQSSSTHHASNSAAASNSNSTVPSTTTQSLKNAIDPKLSVQENRERLLKLSALRKARLEQREQEILAQLDAQQLAEEKELQKEAEQVVQRHESVENDTHQQAQTASGSTAGTPT